MTPEDIKRMSIPVLDSQSSTVVPLRRRSAPMTWAPTEAEAEHIDAAPKAAGVLILVIVAVSFVLGLVVGWVLL